MKTIILFSIVAAGALSAQTQKQAIPEAFRQFRIPPSGQLRFLASEEGRSFLKATGHPLAKAAILAFGEPSKTTAVPPSWFAQARAAEESQSAAPEANGCNGPEGARFNLEPRPNAVPQNQATADFLLNRVGPGEDLIVEAANDWRGNLDTDVNWDQSVSGYYVHRAAANCSVQFEGGLPAFTAQGNTEMGTGNVVVAADAVRDAFYMADVRFGSASTGGVGLFRAPASALLNAATCPSGTHSAAQAASCWASTPPVLIFAQPVYDSVNDMPRIAVDQRATGTGAGNVYVAVEQFDYTTYSSSIQLVACTPALSCSAPATVSVPASTAAAFPYVQVRPDGLITVSFVNGNSDGSDSVFFATCTPVGAPQTPACSAPSLVKQVANPIRGMININLLAYTYPKHASRAEAGGTFTTFLTYDDCKNPFQQVCLNAEVLMAESTDNGQTWSSPVSVDTSNGHHFYPAMAVDASTRIVHLTYYSATGDKFNHEVRVLRNEIAPGGTTLGTVTMVTQMLDPIDGDPQSLGFFQSDLFMGAIARGTGKTGQSRLYTSFDSTIVAGSYQGQPDAEQNNHIGVVAY